MTRRRRIGAGLAAIALIAAGPSSRATDTPADDDGQIGQEVCDELKATTPKNTPEVFLC